MIGRIQMAALAAAASATLAFGAGWSWRDARCGAAMASALEVTRRVEQEAARAISERSRVHAEAIAAAEATNQETIRDLEQMAAGNCIAGPDGLERLRRIK